MRGALAVAVLTFAVVAAGCSGGGDRERASAPDAATATLRIEPVQQVGGLFVEGFLATWEVEGRDDDGLGSELRERVVVPVEPGRRRARVAIYPCSAMCGAQPSGEPIPCERTVRVRADEVLDLTPVSRSGGCTLLTDRELVEQITPVGTAKDARTANGMLVAVRATVVERDGEERMCDVVFDSSPPACGDGALLVRDLDWAGLDPRERAGVRWLDDALVVGTRDEDAFRVLAVAPEKPRQSR